MAIPSNDPVDGNRGAAGAMASTEPVDSAGTMLGDSPAPDVGVVLGLTAGAVCSVATEMVLDGNAAPALVSTKAHSLSAMSGVGTMPSPVIILIQSVSGIGREDESLIFRTTSGNVLSFLIKTSY